MSGQGASSASSASASVSANSVSEAYELQKSYVISQNALSADLQTAVKDPVAFFRIRHMVTVPITTRVRSMDDYAVVQSHFLPSALPADQPIDANAFRAVLMAVPKVIDPTVMSLTTSVRAMCMSLVTMTLYMLMGDQGFRASKLIAYTRGELDKMLTIVESKFPYSAATNGTVEDSFFSKAVPPTLTEHLAMVEREFSTYFLQKIPPDMRDWLFTDAMRVMFTSMVAPYLRVCYVAGLVRGKWNQAGNLNNVSFYDTRYAELSLFRAAMSLYELLMTRAKDPNLASSVDAAARSMVPATTAVALRSTLETGRDGYRDALDTRMRLSDDAIMQGHQDIAKLSAETKGMALDLYSKNNDLSFRKQSLGTLVSMTLADRVNMERSKRVFYAWCAAYAAITLVSIALIATDRFNMFFLMASIVLVVVVLYVFASLLIRVVRGAVNA